MQQIEELKQLGYNVEEEDNLIIINETIFLKRINDIYLILDKIKSSSVEEVNTIDSESFEIHLNNKLDNNLINALKDLEYQYFYFKNGDIIITKESNFSSIDITNFNNDLFDIFNDILSEIKNPNIIEEVKTSSGSTYGYWINFKDYNQGFDYFISNSIIKSSRFLDVCLYCFILDRDLVTDSDLSFEKRLHS